ncbi:MAG: DUF465 domain-containing protein [Salinarimonadaceae bacterium]|nr:MAG: DUF465 domain-containing protein [Salinarimonadaceae bacterium]
MAHTPHELAEDFPEHVERIRELKQSDAHFARLAAEYHEINRAVHRMETRVEPTSEETEEDLRRRRMILKDEIAAILAAA